MKRFLTVAAALVLLAGCVVHRNPGWGYIDDGPAIWSAGAAYHHAPVAQVPLQQPGPNLTPLLYQEPRYSPPAPRFIPYGGVAGSMPGIGPGGYAR